MTATASPEQGYPEAEGNAYARSRSETIFERLTSVGTSSRQWRVWSRQADVGPETIQATLAALQAEFPRLRVRARTFKVTRVLVETQEV